MRPIIMASFAHRTLALSGKNWPSPGQTGYDSDTSMLLSSCRTERIQDLLEGKRIPFVRPVARFNLTFWVQNVSTYCSRANSFWGVYTILIHSILSAYWFS